MTNYYNFKKIIMIATQEKLYHTGKCLFPLYKFKLSTQKKGIYFSFTGTKIIVLFNKILFI